MASFGHELSIDIAAPPDAVWAVIADYARDPEWRTGVRMTVDPPGTVREGSVTHEHLRSMGAWHQTTARIRDVEPGHAFRFVSDDGRVIGTRRVAPTPTGSRVSVQIRIVVPGAIALLAPLLGWSFGRRVRGDLRRLQRLCELPSRANGIPEPSPAPGAAAA